MNIKLWLSLVTTGCLGSCVVIDERQINYHINTTDSHQQHHVSTQLPPTTPVPPSTIEITLPTPPAATPNTDASRMRCDPFSLPVRERLPSVPDFDQSEVTLEVQLANYINSIYATVHEEREAIDRALAKHLQSCGE